MATSPTIKPAVNFWERLNKERQRERGIEGLRETLNDEERTDWLTVPFDVGADNAQSSFVWRVVIVST